MAWAFVSKKSMYNFYTIYLQKWSNKSWGSGDTQITPVTLTVADRAPSGKVLESGKKESSHDYIPRAAAQGVVLPEISKR